MNTNFLRRFKLKSRITFFLVLGIVIFTFTIIYFSRVFSEFIIQKYYYKHLKDIHSDIQEGIYLLLTNINLTSVRLLQNQDIYDLLSNTNLSYNEKEKKLTTYLNTMGINDYIGDIVIVTKKGEVFNFNTKVNPSLFITKELLSHIEDRRNLFVWGPIVKDNGNNYIVLGKRYYNFYTGQYLGYLLMLIDENSIAIICNKSKSSDIVSTLVIDQQNKIISHPESKYVGNIIFENWLSDAKKEFSYSLRTINEGQFLVAISKPSENLERLNCKWFIISLLPLSNLKNQLTKINIIIIWLVFFTLILCVVIAIKAASSLTNPIRFLLNRINSIGQTKNVKPYIYKNLHDEIWELELAFEEMTKRISNLVETINHDMEKQRELELIALQSQINPHFLYNTLDAIAWIAKIKKQPEIENIVMALAKFYRISLHRGEKYIRLSDEIELVKNFVAIEKIRFPNKFDIEFEIAPETTDMKILKFTVQPLVENSIKHGILPKKEKGLIVVKSMLVNEDLHIEVSDNGVGFDPSELDNLSKNGKGGYGLKNVDERLKIEYGKEYGLFISSEKNKGTTILIKVKARNE
ncbi:signal transduction histidine kinase, LytS [Caldicellulosiruptor kronotskyensis 2002]|uniref:Signal transduction histidine kinase, LytS n=1 Tax=Caldicellulosiruptor kronotskyensis (strain DSM 18902 / VKM B-2412 / 2002) TaxID=632348 RepID=E4SCF4_CALK2|nr:sensor histidine kinase [Caldicellulosiruptor kronotskyensis]ADQ45009.1 signal transduction histidine kinase, LytS [Caldicellulosiruptor kronotskyensis 2002]